MNRKKITYIPRLAAICAAAVLALALVTSVYAADVGGIRRTIQLWVRGDQTDAVLEIQDGAYEMTYADETGQEHHLAGGGVAYDIFGRERPLTEQEILEHLNGPEVEYEDDGSVWVYWYDQKVEITDKFDEDGICYVQLIHGGKPLYLTVKYDNGFASSPHEYVNPHSFN